MRARLYRILGDDEKAKSDMKRALELGYAPPTDAEE
ncbi:MAG: hypothetical protein VCD00_21065 [Candidatus Hydrogenedentota bacterium]